MLVFRSTSAIPTAPGSAARTRTPTGCCGSTFQRAPTSACTAPRTLHPWLRPSMSGHAKPWAGEHRPSPLTSCRDRRTQLLRRPLEPGMNGSIAYFLSCRGVQPAVIERAALACAASGKAGGFLALDWCDGTPLEALARRSFALHAELAERIGGEWGYRPLTTYGGLVSAQTRHGDRAHETRWVSDHVTLTQKLGSPRTTAQVHPGQFTAALMRAA